MIFRHYLKRRVGIFSLLWMTLGIALLLEVFQVNKVCAQEPLSDVGPSTIVVQHGPVAPLSTAAFSPDNQFFATASRNVIQIWNRKSGEVEQSLIAPGTVAVLAWSPDGSRLAAGGLTQETGFFRGLVLICEVQTGQVLHDWRIGYATIKALAWSSDGQMLATASGGDFEGRDQRTAARLWTVEGRLVRTFANYYASNAALAISSDDRRIALSFTSDMSGETGTRIFDLDSGKPLTPIKQEWVGTPTFAADGTLRDKSRLPVPLPSLPGQTVAEVSLSPDQHWLVTAGYQSNDKAPKPAFRLWQLDEKAGRWNQVRQVELNRAFPVALAAGRDTLAIGSHGGTVAVLNWRTGKSSVIAGPSPLRYGMTISPDATLLATSFLWNLNGPHPQRGIPLDGNRAMVFSPDGNMLIERDGLVNVKTGQRTSMKIRDEDDENTLTGLQSAAFSADGQILATVDDTQSSDQLHLWSGKTGKFLRRVQLPVYVRFGCVAFSPKGDVLAVAGSQDRSQSFLGLLDGRTGRLLRSFTTDSNDPYGVADIKFSPDGKTLVTTGMVFRGFGNPSANEEQKLIREKRVKSPEQSLRFWDVAGGTLRSSLPLSVNYPVPVAFLSDNICAVITPSGVEFWNATQSKLLARLTILSFSPEKENPVMEWLVTTPDGAYDTSTGASPFLRWRVGQVLQTDPASTASPVPRLLESVLAQSVL